MDALQVRVDQLVERLRERGCRLTPQRIAVLKVLLASPEHPTAEQIYERVHQDFPMVSLATIYKTIHLLEEMGEVLELSIGSESTRYDGINPNPHPHLVCIRCQKVTDVDIPGWEELPEQVAQRYGYKIVNHRLDYFGVCSDCQKLPAEAS